MPDNIAVTARLESGAEVAIQVASVPAQPTGTRLEIYGREGALFLSAQSANIGPSELLGTHGGEALAELEPPDAYQLVPEGTPPGPPRNVAHAYVRMADSLATSERFDPDFDLAVRRHRLLDVIQHSADTGMGMSLSG